MERIIALLAPVHTPASCDHLETGMIALTRFPIVVDVAPFFVVTGLYVKLKRIGRVCLLGYLLRHASPF